MWGEGGSGATLEILWSPCVGCREGGEKQGPNLDLVKKYGPTNPTTKNRKNKNVEKKNSKIAHVHRSLFLSPFYFAFNLFLFCRGSFIFILTIFFSYLCLSVIFFSASPHTNILLLFYRNWVVIVLYPFFCSFFSLILFLFFISRSISSVDRAWWYGHFI